MASYQELRARNKKSLRLALGVTFLFFVVEIVGGILTNSLALLSDAGHMLTDVLALGMSLFAMWFARRPPTLRHSFGYHRLEIFAALLNGLTLIGVSLYIFIEAYHRFQSPPEVAGVPMLIIASIGLVVNLLSSFILHGSKDHNLNIRGAYLHVLGDTLGSVGAILAGVIMTTTGWMYADPLFSIIIGSIIIISSIHLLRETLHVLMQGTPKGIKPEEVRDAIRRLRHVTGSHDLHIWTLTNGIEAMTVHINADWQLSLEEQDDLIREIQALTREQFGIQHTTVQVERSQQNDECCLMHGMHA